MKLNSTQDVVVRVWHSHTFHCLCSGAHAKNNLRMFALKLLHNKTSPESQSFYSSIIGYRTFSPTLLGVLTVWEPKYLPAASQSCSSNRWATSQAQMLQHEGFFKCFFLIFKLAIFCVQNEHKLISVSMPRCIRNLTLHFQNFIKYMYSSAVLLYCTRVFPSCTTFYIYNNKLFYHSLCWIAHWILGNKTKILRFQKKQRAEVQQIPCNSILGWKQIYLQLSQLHFQLSKHWIVEFDPFQHRNKYFCTVCKKNPPTTFCFCFSGSLLLSLLNQGINGKCVSPVKCTVQATFPDFQGENTGLVKLSLAATAKALMRNNV